MFVLQNIEIPQLEIPGLKLAPYEKFKNKTSKFDLTLQAIETGDQLLFIFEYRTGLFKEETILRFINCFNIIISSVIDHPGVKIAELEIITAEEKQRVLSDFNDTQTGYPKDKTIPVNRPGNTAVVYEDKQLTYRELDERVDRLAGVLRAKGVRPDCITAIMVERSIEMMVGILGILRAGGGYLPIVPGYPGERLDYMLADSGAKVLLTSTGARVKERLIEIIDISDLSSFSTLTLTSTLTCQVSSTNLAYVIYTSGSTGKPKGVMVEHGSLMNILLALFERYPFFKRDTYLLKTSYLFDVSLTELFGWLIGGGKLVLLKEGGEKDPQMILDTIARTHITHINFVPSMFHVFVNILGRENIGKLSGLKCIFLAGEALGTEVVATFTALNRKVILENLYGPTEAAIYASGYSLQDWHGHGCIPIGKPLENVRLYILDKYDHLQSIGIPGELCISGAGLARGYLNRPGLTAEKFRRAVIRSSDKLSINDQCPMTNDRSSKLYLTGDLARWLPDGNIEFLGRMDQQVKIRGYRIELGEIKNRLLKNEKIKDAVVVVKGEESKERYLCAYIVSDKEFEISGLQEYLSLELPDYMIPSYFVRLEEIPLTPNGKIDRKALPMPMTMVSDTVVPPENATQERLVGIWSDLMGIKKERISIDINFFKLGGHSLKAVLLTAKIHEAFNIKLSLTEIYKNSTIRRIASLIDIRNWVHDGKRDDEKKREEVFI